MKERSKAFGHQGQDQGLGLEAKTVVAGYEI